jgi:hypothetical protein
MSGADVLLLAPPTGLYDFIATVSLEALPRDRQRSRERYHVAFSSFFFPSNNSA